MTAGGCGWNWSKRKGVKWANGCVVVVNHKLTEKKIKHSKKCSNVIKLFKKIYNNIFYPRLQYYLFLKSNDKSLSNCNRNFRGQPSVWIGWLLPSCTICTYRDPKPRQLDKKRSSPIIILLYLSWYCKGKPPSTNQKFNFQPIVGTMVCPGWAT